MKLIFIILMYILFSIGCSSKIQRGKVLLSEGKTNEAIQFFESLQQEEANNKEFRFYFAKSLEKNGNLDESLLQTEAGLSLSPFDANLHFLKGKIYFQKKDYFKAISVLKYTIELDSNVLEAYLLLALSLEQIGKPKEALKELSKIIFLEKHNYDIRVEFIRIQFKSAIDTSLFETWIEELQQVILLKPEDSKGVFLLADIYEALGESFQAEKVLKDWLQKYPSDLNALEKLANVYYKKGDLENSLKILNAHEVQTLSWNILEIKNYLEQTSFLIVENLILQLELDFPNSIELKVLKAKSDFYQGKYELAERNVRTIFLQEPTLIDARFLLVQILEKKRLFEEAKTELEILLSQYPTDLLFQTKYIELLMEQGNWWEAQFFINKLPETKQYTKKIELEGDIALAKKELTLAYQKFLDALNIQYSFNVELKLARIEIEQEKWVLAKERLERLFTANPNDVALLLEFARFYYFQNKPQNVISLLQKKSLLGDGKLTFFLAESYFLQKQFQQGKNILEAGLKKWPMHELLVDSLSLHLMQRKEYRRAILILKRFVEAYPEKSNLFYTRLFLCYQAMGNSNTANQYLKEYIQLKQ